MNDETRSPIKDEPLRLPGQSVEEERRRLIEDKFEMPAAIAALTLGFMVTEWWRYYSGAPPSPVLFTILAAVAVAFVVWRYFRLRPRLRALRLAITGEKAVGQYLEGLRARGYRVFHDVIGSNFNVDHVLIGPAGVFTVETKTWSKPQHGDHRVVFDGRLLVVGRRPPDDRVVVQAFAQARWLRDLLAESTGRRLPVRPVVLFPGWFVEQKTGATRELWVLEPKAIQSFLDNADQRFTPEDVAFVSLHLARIVRAREREQRRNGR